MKSTHNARRIFSESQLIPHCTFLNGGEITFNESQYVGTYHGTVLHVLSRLIAQKILHCHLTFLASLSQGFR